MGQQSEECPAEAVDSEDVLFMLYTSGSTGRPKGLVHTQAGYCYKVQEYANTPLNIVTKEQLAVTIMCNHMHTTTNTLHPFLPI